MGQLMLFHTFSAYMLYFLHIWSGLGSIMQSPKLYSRHLTSS